MCGNHSKAKQAVSELARDIGYDPVYAGPQSMAR